MHGVIRRAEVEDSEVENGQILTLPCVSPLHAIPGFDRLSIRKLYSKGSQLLVEGQPACGVYVLCSGRAKLSITSAEGKTLIVRIAQPGDLLGIHATLAALPYEATAKALGSCSVDFISRKDLLVLLDRQKSFSLGLAFAMSKEFTEFLEHTRVMLLPGTTAEKLAGLFLRWGDAFGHLTASGIHLQQSLTHEELGQMIGVSRETVTRALNELKRSKLIWATKDDLWIRNRVALAELAKGMR